MSSDQAVALIATIAGAGIAAGATIYVGLHQLKQARQDELDRGDVKAEEEAQVVVRILQADTPCRRGFA